MSYLWWVDGVSLSRADRVYADAVRANLPRKEKVKWNSKHSARIRAVVAPGQKKLAVKSESRAVKDERQKNYDRFVNEPRSYFRED